MPRKRFALLAILVASSPSFAQDIASGRCTTPDSVAVRGNKRVQESTILTDAGITPGTVQNFKSVQRSLRALFATGNFDDAKVICQLNPAGDRATFVIDVRERAILTETTVEGVKRLSAKTVRDQIDLPYGKPLDPAGVATALKKIDSLYEASGYYLARVHPETTMVGEAARLTFRVDEGRRLAVSGVRVAGNQIVPSKTVVGAMKTKPEGFFWWKRGEFDDETFAGDVADRLPTLYAGKGFIDFTVTEDTLLVDREKGKALVELKVNEGPRYRVGDFEIAGNRRFSSEDVNLFYPFGPETRSFTSQVTGFLLRKKSEPKGTFNRAAWEDATNKIRTAYSNEGYIYATVRPILERRVTADSTHVVDLRWEVDEKTPAIINRIEIAGNDYTTEACIRDQLVILPGDVFNQDRLIRSWQSISNLGFFEAPIPPPDTRTANEQGDVDIIFRVKEKRTGNVNFGASMGQGTGVGGFIGLDQPNLFGLCKRGSLQWQFGRYINDFNLSYSDPRIKESVVSGTVSAYRTQARYQVGDLGRVLRTGANLQFGFPVMNSPYSRLFLSYGAENARFGRGGLLQESRDEFGNGSFRSTLGTTFTHDTRIDMPFPTSGGIQTLTAQFNGGVLGGTASFQRYTIEARGYAPLGALGGGRPGSQPIKFVAGLSARSGAVFGNTDAFFYSQEFSMGGVQFGEQLRGYDEFSITPDGFITGTNSFNAQRASFGKAFFAATAEAGMRVNQALYVGVFYDAGNVWRNARQIDPSRLFRGAGISASTVTPLGPLGLDYAYGFDRVDQFGRPAPKWQLHFRLGQLF